MTPAGPAGLHLHEEVLLLALQDVRGTVTSGTWSVLALAGALLAELMIEERLDAATASSQVAVRSTTPLGNELLDESLSCIARSSSPRSLQAWLSELSRLPDLTHRTAQGLCDRGVLTSGRETFLFLFERRVFPERDHGPEKAIVQRLHAAIFEEGTVDPRTVALLSIAGATAILSCVFDEVDLAPRNDRIRRIVAGQAAGTAAGNVVAAIRSAATVATVLAPRIAVIRR